MKKINLCLCVSLITCSMMYAGYYPTSYSYGGFITPAHDQLAQGPCHTFATIACIEAMYKLYYGTTIYLSEKALYNTATEDLSSVLEAARTKGVILESCNTYPDTVPCSGSSRQALEYVEIPDYDWAWDHKNCGTRFKITYKNISGSPHDADTIRKLLIQYGPIIVATSQHTMLLYGWTGNDFLFKDSGPCTENLARKETISFFSGVAQMYVIDKVTKEVYNTSTHTWNTVSMNKKAFTMSKNPAVYPVSLNEPSSCFNLGTYEAVIDKIPGAEVHEWLDNNTGIYTTASADKKYCTLSGFGTNDTLIMVVKRKNGLLQNFRFPIGTVGVPSITVEKVSAYCAGSNYEITTKISHPNVPGVSCSYNYNIPPLHNNSYVIKNGRYAYWVFKAPETVTYSASVTFSKDGCSVTKSRNTYVYSLPCGYYYKSGPEGNTENINPDENELFIYPNPAGDRLTVRCIGEGTNHINIYDITGRAVYSGNIGYTTEIDISRLSKGIYIVECYVENKEFLRRKEKLIVE